MPSTSVYVPRGSSSCLLPLWEALQDQQVGLTWGPFKLLPLHWVLEHVGFCVSSIRLESLFPTVLWLSHIQAPLAFKARYSGAPPSQCKTPGPRNMMWGSDPLLLEENLSNCDSPPVCGSPNLGVWVLTIPYLCPSYPFHCDSFFISLAAENLFC